MLSKEIQETFIPKSLSIRVCHECGHELENPAPNQKYCSSCSDDIQREKARLRKQKERRLRKIRGMSANNSNKGTMYFLNSKTAKDDTGKIDFDKEKERIRKEKRALRLIK